MINSEMESKSNESIESEADRRREREEICHGATCCLSPSLRFCTVPPAAVLPMENWRSTQDPCCHVMQNANAMHREAETENANLKS